MSTPLEPAPIQCLQCGNVWESRARIGSNIQCPNCKKRINVSKRHRPSPIAADTRWAFDSVSPEFSLFNCPECNAAGIWTLGRTSVKCSQCGNVFVSPTAIERGLQPKRSREIQVKIDPQKEILDKAILYSRKQDSIQFCQEILDELNTDEYGKQFPGLARPVGFSNEEKAIKYRNIFISFANQVQTVQTVDELENILTVIQKTRKRQEIDSVIANIRMELSSLARRISALTNSQWTVTDGKIVPADWRDHNEYTRDEIAKLPAIKPKVISSYRITDDFYSPNTDDNNDADIVEADIIEINDEYETLRENTEPDVWHYWELIQNSYQFKERISCKYFKESPIEKEQASELENLINHIGEFILGEEMLAMSQMIGWTSKKGYLIEIEWR